MLVWVQVPSSAPKMKHRLYRSRCFVFWLADSGIEPTRVRRKPSSPILRTKRPVSSDTGLLYYSIFIILFSLFTKMPSLTKNVFTPFSLSAHILPLCSAIILFAIDKPSP